MPVTGVSVKGLNELRSALNAAGGPELVKALTAANKGAANVVVDAATPLVPRRYGDLAHSLRATASSRSGRVRAGSARVPYAAAIHWGRKSGNVGSPPGNHRGNNRIKGRPFLTDALRRNWPRVAREYEREIDIIMRKVDQST